MFHIWLFDFRWCFTMRITCSETGAAICVYFLRQICDKGTQCPFRHVSGEKSVVCKHWLRGLCKKGDMCEFLHEYDLSKMPECYFFSKYSIFVIQNCFFACFNPKNIWQMRAVIKSVLFDTLTPRAKSRIVPGTTGDFVATVRMNWCVSIRILIQNYFFVNFWVFIY